MERNNLELACNSLFIEKIKNAFKAAEINLLSKVYSFSKQRIYVLVSVSFQAADAISLTDALLTPLLWQGHTHPDEVIKHFGKTTANTIRDLNSPVILLKTPFQGKFP